MSKAQVSSQNNIFYHINLTIYDTCSSFVTMYIISSLYFRVTAKSILPSFRCIWKWCSYEGENRFLEFFF